jgi:exodeoxyribonuclease-5
MKLRNEEGLEYEAHMLRATQAYEAALKRIAREADTVPERWGDLHAMKQFFGNYQPVYARTVHTAQGETHKHTFLDVADIRQRAKGNPLEAQQLAYVGATRPTTSLILAGV